MIEDADGANHYIILSFAHAFQALGHSVFFWNSSQRSCFDAFYEFSIGDPIDLYVGHSWKLTPAIVKNLIARPNIKIILRASHYGDLDDTIDRVAYPVGIASDEEKRLVEELKNNQPNFQYLTCQYSQTQMELYKSHNKWQNLGLQTRGILLCADLMDYYYTSPTKEFESDCVWAGNYWAYKSKYLSWLYGLCYPNTQLSVRISGNGWSTPSCIGVANEHSLRNLYSSSKVCPNLYEPHAIEVYSDLNQRLYQTSICGGFQVSQRAIGIDEVFPDNEIVLCDDRKDFYEKVIYYCTHRHERLPFIRKAVKRIYAEHTNFHRTAELLLLLGETEQADKALTLAREAYDHIKNQLEEDTFQESLCLTN